MQVQANQGTGFEALFKRGFYARLQGDLDKASEDLNASMQLFALHHPVLPYGLLSPPAKFTTLSLNDRERQDEQALEDYRGK